MEVICKLSFGQFAYTAILTQNNSKLDQSITTCKIANFKFQQLMIGSIAYEF